MNRLFVIIELLLVATGSSAKAQLVEAFTHPLNSDSIIVFSKPGRFYSYLQPDDEAGWIVHVINEKNGFFEVILPKECEIRQKKYGYKLVI